MKIFKLATAVALVSASLATSLFASKAVDDKVIAYEKQRFLTNQGLKLQEVNISTKEALPVKGWYGYVLQIKANVPGRGIVGGQDMLFSNGEAVTMELIDMKSGNSFKELLTPKVSIKYYKKDHLIAGNSDAKNQVVVFSDPLCPYCQQTIPGMIEKACRDYNIDPVNTVMIGDKKSDVDCGRNAGAKSVLVLTGYGKEESKSKDLVTDYTAEDCYDAVVNFILKDPSS